MTSANGFRIGIIADTHGFLPLAAEEALQGVGAIVHAGDVGEGYVLDLLGGIAPVTAVRGNNRHASERGLPLSAVVRLGGVLVGVAHRAHDVPHVHPQSGEAVAVAVSGHTHRGAVSLEDGILLVNPGSPSEPRGTAVASIAIVTVSPGGEVVGELVPLAR